VRTHLKGKTKIDAFQKYLRDVITQVSALRTQGLSADDAAQKVDVTAYRNEFASIRGVGIDVAAVRGSTISPSIRNTHSKNVFVRRQVVEHVPEITIFRAPAAGLFIGLAPGCVLSCSWRRHAGCKSRPDA